MSSHHLALCSVLALVACDVGDVRDLDTLPDAGAEDPGVDGAPAACRETVPDVGGGEHNPGQACIACHLAEGAPQFTLAGTLYTDAAGTAPVVGGTIIVTDATGASVDMITQANGNFWTTQALTYPVRVAASQCPDTVPMAGAITAAGDCNAGGCHAAGSSSGRVHLP